jgi:hypothetical protein
MEIPWARAQPMDEMAMEKPAATAEYMKNLKATTLSASVASAANANVANPRTSTSVRNSTFLFMQKTLLVATYFMAFFLTTTFFPNPLV